MQERPWDPKTLYEQGLAELQRRMNPPLVELLDRRAKLLRTRELGGPNTMTDAFFASVERDIERASLP